MDIPLKSKPQVLMVNILEESAFQRKTEPPPERAISTEMPALDATAKNPQPHYKLTRTYSETETNNFDLNTGHRLFDDGKIRPTLLRNNSPVRGGFIRNTTDIRSNLNPLTNTDLELKPISGSVTPRIYSRSHDEGMDEENAPQFNAWGMEDEYIPGLDFGSMVYRWNHTDDLSRKTSHTNTYSLSGTPASRDGSYLDLNLLHSKVAPQPIHRGANILFLKLSDLVRLRTPQDGAHGRKEATGTPSNLANNFTLGGKDSTSTSLSADDPLAPPKPKRQRSTTEIPVSSSEIVNPTTGEINYEALLNSLPSNFNELPYSQRKKVIKSYSELIDYSQFSLIAKQFFSDRIGASQGSSGGSSGRLARSSSSFLRKSRRNSVNTVAGKLLALSSTTDLDKLNADSKPKENVDEKGAIVLGFELGKVIGFGAWGTIRECKNCSNHSDIKACKIVHSCRVESSSPGATPKHNAKVLDRFRQEIKIWLKLNHPNILPLLNHVETDTAIFCISDRIYGGTLFEVVTGWGVFNGEIFNSSGPLGFLIENQCDRLSQTREIALQVVDALGYMHQELGIVHGDIKLENVLVDNREPGNPKMILCDFGMSRIYSSRLSRRNSLVLPNSDEMGRSKSSMTTNRKPLQQQFESPNNRFLFHDDLKIGISNLTRNHGPSLQSVDLTPSQSSETIVIPKSNSKINLFDTENRTRQKSGIESNLPHLHIGSLPYASPELILPSPPPLGPSADIWALGVLLYTMVVGKLPFQHQYEPRLRAIISAGKYDKQELKKACLVEFIFDGENERHNSIQSSFMDLKREEEIESLTEAWKNYDHEKYEWMYELISGCLESNITKRLDLEAINRMLKS